MEKDYAARYGEIETWHWWFRGRRRILEALLRRELPDTGSRDVLSVGCGPATGLKWLVPFCGREGKVVGLDADVNHAQEIDEQVEFVVSHIEHITLPEASFDLVLALDVLEHLDDDLAALKRIVRLIKPGGLLLLTVPALPSLWGSQDEVSQHRRRYTKRSLDSLFDAASLSNHRIKYFNSLLFPLAASVRWTRRALGQDKRLRTDFDDNHPGTINDTLAWIFGIESTYINRASMPIGLSLVATYRVPIVKTGNGRAPNSQ
jgi:SAM-dependent methyltransferase